MPGMHQVILERDAELAVLVAAAGAAKAGHGAFVLVEGPAGIGKTTLLRAACARPGGLGARILTARGLALESGFSYGIVRQLIEPVRISAGPGRVGRAAGRARPGSPRACSTGPVPDRSRTTSLCNHARPVLAGREPRGPRSAGDRRG